MHWTTISFEDQGINQSMLFSSCGDFFIDILTHHDFIEEWNLPVIDFTLSNTLTPDEFTHQWGEMGGGGGGQ